MRNRTSVSLNENGNWSTYIRNTLPQVYPLVNSCADTASPTRVPTVARRRQLVSSEWSYHHTRRSLQSYDGGCQAANSSDVAQVVLAFATDGSTTNTVLAAWEAAVTNISSGGSLGPYNSSNICSVNTEPEITYVTGSPTPGKSVQGLFLCS